MTSLTLALDLCHSGTGPLSLWNLTSLTLALDLSHSGTGPSSFRCWTSLLALDCSHSCTVPLSLFPGSLSFWHWTSLTVTLDLCHSGTGPLSRWHWTSGTVAVDLCDCGCGALALSMPLGSAKITRQPLLTSHHGIRSDSKAYCFDSLKWTLLRILIHRNWCSTAGQYVFAMDGNEVYFCNDRSHQQKNISCLISVRLLPRSFVCTLW